MASNVDDTRACPVCFEEYTRSGDYVPLMLPICTHTVCKKCKDGMVNANPGAMLTCPIDNTTKYPKGQVFPENRYIIANIPEVWKGEGTQQRDLKFEKCLNHKARDLNLYCGDCDGAMCELCMNKEHVGHDVVDMSDQIDLKKAEIIQKEEKYTTLQKKLAKAKETLAEDTEKTLTKITETRDALKREIDVIFDGMTKRVTDQNDKTSQELVNSEKDVADFLKQIRDMPTENYGDLTRKDDELCHPPGKVWSLFHGKAHNASDLPAIFNAKETVEKLGLKLGDRKLYLDIHIDRKEFRPGTLELTALRSIPTNFNYVFPLRLRGDSVFLAGATTDGGDDHFVKRFNLTSGKETQAVKIPEPWGLATVKLGAQHCIAGSYGNEKRIDFWAEDLSRVVLTHSVALHKPTRMCAASPTLLLYQNYVSKEIHWLDCSTNPPKPAPGKNSLPARRCWDMCITRDGDKSLLITSGYMMSGITCYDTETGAERWRVEGQLPGMEKEFCPLGVTADGTRRVFVCDINNMCVHMFDVSDGQHLGWSVLMKGEQGLVQPRVIQWSEANKSLVVGHFKDNKYIITVFKAKV